MGQKLKKIRRTKRVSKRSILLTSVFVLLFAGIILAVLISQNGASKEKPQTTANTKEKTAESGIKEWQAPEESTIPSGKDGELIKYGRELIFHTSAYLGSNGSVAAIANGMNCQNCHNSTGTKSFGINYSAVAATYPLFRPRANKKISIVGRINGCFERRMNGEVLDSTTKEMKALVAYMEWLGKDVPKGVKPDNAGIKKLPYLNIAANPKSGQAVFIKDCQVCHGAKGDGILNAKGNEYTYPPLWGKDSYNDGAGLYRLGNFAGFVKYNMPFGVTSDHPQLSDEMRGM